MANEVSVDKFSESINGASSARIDIDSGTGNLFVDRLAEGEQALASGALQYRQKQGVPNRSLNMNNGQAALTLSAGNTGRTGFRFPWGACDGKTEWYVHLNAKVPSEITAISSGGNIRLDLAGMVVSRLSVENWGGNVDVVMPDNTSNLGVTARSKAGNVVVQLGSGISGNAIVNASSGAGNVVVRLPGGVDAKIHAASKLGKVVVDSRFSKIDSSTYQSPDYDRAADRVEITIHSGAGNVNVNTK